MHLVQLRDFFLGCIRNVELRLVVLSEIEQVMERDGLDVGPLLLDVRGGDAFR